MTTSQVLERPKVVVGRAILKTWLCSGPASTVMVIWGLPVDLGGVRTMRLGVAGSAFGLGVVLIQRSFLEGID